MGAGGEPVWPPEVTGSLSHNGTHAAAIVTRLAHHAAVGVDLDDQRLLGAAASAELMTGAEIEAVLAQGWTRDPAIAQNLVFVAKEALFKYQYVLIGRRELDFDEVRLRASDRLGVLAASSTFADPVLQRALAPARVFQDEVQGLRICWVLTSS